MYKMSFDISKYIILEILLMYYSWFPDDINIMCEINGQYHFPYSMEVKIFFFSLNCS